jgi:GNAT superfamily N-acetyltransferase
VVPLVATEIRAWRDVLLWDVAEAWSVIEPARRAGHLPGLIAFDAGGRPHGWTTFLPHNGHLQVMALVAPDSATASALVDGLLDSAEARACASVLLCVRDAAPGLADVLHARGFTIDPYRYMMANLVDAPRAAGPCERWQAHDELMAGLCAEAYRDSPGVRAFAPGGTLPEWRQYIATIVEGTGCGWFLPELSQIVAGVRTGMPGIETVDACLMLSDLGTGTAHIAQLAVAPAARGRGLGRQLVSTAMGEASRFYARMSLLVSASNIPAGRLYASLGFQDHATFIVAAKPTAAP